MHILVSESIVLSLCPSQGHVAGQVMLESSSCVFPHRFHQILTAVTNFARIVPVLSSNSESVRKTGLVFAYELGFRRSIYQNQSEIFFGFIHPQRCWI